jgi:nitrite reductase (NADH) small subunit
MTITSPNVTITITSEQSSTKEWLQACNVDDLVANSGVCVLIGNKQIAVFCIFSNSKIMEVYACDNYDPFGKANVLARGILCSVAGEVCICSPLYKQHFSLNDGRCLEDASESIGVYKAQVKDGVVSLLMSQEKVPQPQGSEVAGLST